MKLLSLLAAVLGVAVPSIGTEPQMRIAHLGREGGDRGRASLVPGADSGYRETRTPQEHDLTP